MPQVDAGKAYWRSLNDLADTPEFREMVANEFPSRLDAVIDPVSRRRFVQVMGASFALAGLTGCDFVRWPKEKILPFARRPEGREPGIPVAYASAMELGGVATGLLVTTYDGRPIKIEGNPEHPGSLGATTAWAQASVLGLYDPDRSRAAIDRSDEKAGAKPITWDAFVAAVGERLEGRRSDKGRKLSILSAATSSPTVQRLREELTRSCPRLHWYEYEPINGDNATVGSQMVFGTPFRALVDLGAADVVVSLDADLFGDDPAAVRNARRFADRRRRTDADGSMNRLYSIESTFSLTGGTADVRRPVKASEVVEAGLALAAAVLEADPKAAAGVDEALKTRIAAAAAPAGTAPLLAKIAADLAANRGRSVVTVGRRQPPVLHAVAQLLNTALGNQGRTVTYATEPARPTSAENLATLVAEMNNSRVDTLLILGANPMLTAPADVDFKAALEKVPCSIHLGLYDDETAQLCSYHLPEAHYLEAWGDARAFDGTISMIQPAIRPLFGGKSAIELLALVLGRDPKDAAVSHGYNLVRETYRAQWGTSFEARWRQALHDGVVAGSAFATVPPGRDDRALLDHLNAWAPAATPAGFEVVLVPDDKVYDGRFANNGWLQELPHPLTKITWDNALLVAPGTKDSAGKELAEGTLVELTVREGDQTRSMKAPVYVLPGLPDGCGTLSLGYGRTGVAGVVADGVGFDAYAIRSSKSLDGVVGVTVTAVGSHPLATTQDHHTVLTEISKPEMARRAADLVREGTLDAYKADPKFAKSAWDGGPTEAKGDEEQHGAGPNPATTVLWKEPQEFAGRRWGMAIDLNVCTGCSVCVVACQAENNIPVVGKSEVARGREMHWLRIDRYFSTQPLVEPKAEAEEAAPEPARVVHQPMPCQQCENAPCESVCPVAATTHSEEGLNDMAYNRCVGTRYCANNCTYKVRRFNFFYNHHGPFHPRSNPGENPELPKLPKSVVTDTLGLPHAAATTKLEELAFNPEVSVRARGVMEKCTYCVQRIKAATIPHDNAHRGDNPPRLPDGAIQTACQQACPTQAITFGDLNDPGSAVSKAHASDRTYGLLVYLNTRPRTKYQAKIRNLPPTSA